MKIYAAESDGTLRLGFTGELDHHGAKQAMKTIDDLIDEYLPRNLVIDLGRLSFMDSSGIALMLRANRRMADMGGRAWVENPLGQPLRVLNASGVDRVIRVFEKTS